MTDQVEMTKTEQPGAETATEQTATNDGGQMTVDQLKAENERIARALKEANNEAAKRRKKLEEYEKQELTRQQAELTEAEKLKSELDQVRAELKTSRLTELKRSIAAEVGLPDAFIPRLMGEEAQDIREDAKKLLEAIPKPKPTPSPTNPGQAATEGRTEAQMRNAIYGSAANIFDPEVARRHGGGVFIK